MRTRDISQLMRRIKSTDTEPEKILRKALRAKGFRFRVCPPRLEGKPDIVFPKDKVAVFVDGDFWHGNQWQKRGLSALEDQFRHTTAKEYWLKKIRGNMRRDCTITAKLLADGWTVIRFWESEVTKNLEKCLEITVDALNRPVSPSSVTSAPRKTFAEFFAGIGLMRLGLEREGWTIGLANDIDQEKFEMYRAHFQDGTSHFLVGDIHNIHGADVPQVTLATASFPCNDLSLAGGRRGLAGSQSSAFWGFVRIIEEMGQLRPPLVLVENVPGFLTSHGGGDFCRALTALNRLGYAVDAFLIDAARFVPQSRQRLFIVGIHEAPNIANALGTRNFYESEHRPKALAEFVFGHPEINWRIQQLPPLPQTKAVLDDILEKIPEDDPIWWSKERSEYLLNQMSSKHRATAEAMIQKKRWSYGTVFRRVRHGKSMAELRIDGLAGCLRTPRGGSGRQILFKAGYGRYNARLITPRECARLMGADDFTINATLNQALFGFGDAVCVPVIEWIARYYLNPVVAEIMRGTSLKEPARKYA